MVLSFKKAYIAAEKALTAPCEVEALKVRHDGFTREAESKPLNFSEASGWDDADRAAKHEDPENSNAIIDSSCNESRPKIEADYENGIIEVPHLGITLRVLLGAASNVCEGRKTRRNWTLWYNEAKIGTVRIKTQDLLD